MSKRLEKRHKRQVLRGKERVKTSQPDVRTPEEIKAAREASRPTGGWGGGPSRAPFASGNRNRAIIVKTGSKSDA